MDVTSYLLGKANGGGGSYVLPIASAETLGGIKVGNNLSIDENGVLSSVSSNEIKQITSDTNIWTLDNGIYYVDSSNIKLYPSSNTSWYFGIKGYMFVYQIDSASVVKRFYAFPCAYRYNKGGSGGTRNDGYIIYGASENRYYSNSFDELPFYNIVLNNTQQSISAKKTFSVLPESSVAPTTDNQLANKKYVDDTVANAIGTALGGSY